MKPMSLLLRTASGCVRSTVLIGQRSMYQAAAVATTSDAPIVDLRSDTLTLPCAEMKAAIMRADLGDDVYGEDPSVNSLQRRLAEAFGKPSALFVLSGSMGNLISVMAHCSRRGEEAILGHMSHIHIYEQGSIASLAGVHHRTVVNRPDGTFDLEAARSLIRSAGDPHFPRTALIAIENTHNACGGRVLPMAFLKELHQMAREVNLPVHMDGARIMNAATSLNVDVSEIACFADSISMCFSKGLGAPMGAVVVGEEPFIKTCLWHRKALGGGMRQAGMMAAAAQFGFDRACTTMREDHRRARDLAEAISKAVSDMPRPPFAVDMSAVESNMVFVRTLSISAAQLCQRLAEVSASERSALGSSGCCVVLSAPSHTGAVRLVVHRSLTEHGVKLAAEKLAFVAKELIQSDGTLKNDQALN